MIKVTRLSGKKYMINCDLIESIESTPDTVITLTTGKKIVVLEDVDQMIDKIIKYKQKIFSQIDIKFNSLRNEV
ncbi:flagellar FlbD family protein [Anaerophilus nitritogenes]|uniref:flagellar FlbD family protein n=1 Tax=Anaerophilus nitritogenes TaxID=2498136 RepID=UPI00101C9745|nr:flagellar FlbD family protein [Anaerophilus nitritogenes]